MWRMSIIIMHVLLWVALLSIRASAFITTTAINRHRSAGCSGKATASCLQALPAFSDVSAPPATISFTQQPIQLLVDVNQHERLAVHSSVLQSHAINWQRTQVQPLAQVDINNINNVAALSGPTTAMQSSSWQLALQERKAPTAEEIAQKKMTFNLIFWGGGFVAPFLATIFYFGFKFWEK